MPPLDQYLQRRRYQHQDARSKSDTRETPGDGLAVGLVAALDELAIPWEAIGGLNYFCAALLFDAAQVHAHANPTSGAVCFYLSLAGGSMDVRRGACLRRALGINAGALVGRERLSLLESVPPVLQATTYIREEELTTGTLGVVLRDLLVMADEATALDASDKRPEEVNEEQERLQLDTSAPAPLCLDDFLIEARENHPELVNSRHGEPTQNQTQSAVEDCFTLLGLPWERGIETDGGTTLYMIRTDLGTIHAGILYASAGPVNLLMFIHTVDRREGLEDARYLRTLLLENAGGPTHGVIISITDEGDEERLQLSFWLVGDDLLGDAYSLASMRNKLTDLLKIARLAYGAELNRAGLGKPAARRASYEGPSNVSEASQDEAAPTLPQLIEQLDNLIGLTPVKEQVRTIANVLRIQQLRRDRGLPVSRMSNHVVFTGPPGTGKTTVARLLGQIYRALGLLDSGHLVEAARQDLVAEYVGQTAVKTNKLISRAMHGVLFVDEAYTLAPRDSTNDFGREAIDTLLKRMDDSRDKFVVIVAGYPDEMDRFIHANPGLESRFTRSIDFPDYSPVELLDILDLQAREGGYTLTPGARKEAERILTAAWTARDRSFGNGRTVRNLFELALSAQADRLATGSARVTDEALSRIEAQDIAQP